MTTATQKEKLLEAPMVQVLIKASLKAMGIPFSNPTLLRMERRGTFPHRFYLGSKTPAWNVSAVMTWLAEREASVGERNAVTDQATRAKLRRKGIYG